MGSNLAPLALILPLNAFQGSQSVVRGGMQSITRKITWNILKFVLKSISHRDQGSVWTSMKTQGSCRFGVGLVQEGCAECLKNASHSSQEPGEALPEIVSSVELNKFSCARTCWRFVSMIPTRPGETLRDRVAM